MQKIIIANLILLSVFVTFLIMPVFAGNDYYIQQKNAKSSVEKKLKSYKDISKKPWLINKFKEQNQNLQEESINIVSKYVNGAVRGENTFLLINCYLRNNLQDYIQHKDITNPLKCRLKYYADSLSFALNDTRIPQDTILYKYADNKEIKALLNDKQALSLLNKSISSENLIALKARLNNTKFQDNGFILATYDKNIIKKDKYLFKIYAQKNTKAMLIEDYCKNLEKPVIINKGYCWQIIDINIEPINTNHNCFVISIKQVKD